VNNPKLSKMICYATDIVGSVTNNIGLKFALWLPYVFTMIFFLIGMVVIMIRYGIPSNDTYYLAAYIVLYGAFLNGSIYLRKKYWILTQVDLDQNEK